MRSVRRNVQYTYTCMVYLLFILSCLRHRYNKSTLKNHHRLIRMTDFCRMDLLFFVHTRFDNIFIIAYVLTRARRTIIQPSITPHFVIPFRVHLCVTDLNGVLQNRNKPRYSVDTLQEIFVHSGNIFISFIGSSVLYREDVEISVNKIHLLPIIFNLLLHFVHSIYTA